MAKLRQGQQQTGLFSGVFGYVSREIGQFVSTATGNDLIQDFSDSEDDESQPQPIAEPVSRDDSAPPSPVPVPTLATPAPSRSTGVLKRRKSFTMPGSLFPRSPSVDPDIPPQIQEDRDRHVHFAASIDLPPSPPMSQVKSSTVSVPRPSSSSSSSSNPPPSASPLPIIVNLPASPPPPSPRLASKGKARASEEEIRSWNTESLTSTERHVQGMEDQLKIVRQQHDEQFQHPNTSMDEQERLLDKRRIRALEDEVSVLKAELAKRPSHFIPIPPPPPPPPPPLFVPSASSGATSMFSQVRAGLKHAPTPREAPINPSTKTRRPGQPMVGLAPDKVAAFLNEVKTVRLRKVSEGPAASDCRAASRSMEAPASRTFSAGDGNPAVLRKLGLSSVSSRTLSLSTSRIPEHHIGDKRKRLNSQVDLRSSTIGAHPAKRRHPINDIRYSSIRLLARPQSSISAEPENSSTSGSWHPPPPTPSLCSDNDADASPSDHAPSTPPVGPGTSRQPAHRLPTPESHSGSQEIIDVDMLDVPQSTKGRRHPPSTTYQSHSKGPITPPAAAFANRLPKSPLPNHSPQRPRPPASARKRMMPPPPTPHSRLDSVVLRDDEDDEDPLSLSFNADELFAVHQEVPGPMSSTPAATAIRTKAGRKVKTKSPVPRSRARRQEDSTTPSDAPPTRTNPKRAATKKTSRKTLDDELEDAFRRQSDSYDEHLFESGVYQSVGTRDKKKGFLAHGGAGGPSVFMGVGYVQGVEEDDDDEYVDDPHVRPRSNRRSM